MGRSDRAICSTASRFGCREAGWRISAFLRPIRGLILDAPAAALDVSVHAVVLSPFIDLNREALHERAGVGATGMALPEPPRRQARSGLRMYRIMAAGAHFWPRRAPGFPGVASNLAPPSRGQAPELNENFCPLGAPG
jgi:hypothetical protein